jgi:tetratricopeptide (TPR) repeat protein
MPRRSYPLHLLAVVAALVGVASGGAGRTLELNILQDPDAFYDLGMANIVSGNYETAVANFDAVIRIHQLDDRPYHMRCWARAVIGRDLRRALADCNEVLRLNPNNFYVFDARGFTYLKLGEFGRSIADYDAILKFDPKRAASLYGRGVAKRNIGDSAGSDVDIGAAKTIEPEIAEQFARYGVK